MSDAILHIVECRFGKVRYFREMDLADADHEMLIRDFLSGEFDHPCRVIAFNTGEGWSRDVSEDIARTVVERACQGAQALANGVRAFCERHGVDLPLAITAEC